MRWKDLRRIVIAHAVRGITWCLAIVPLRFSYGLGGALGLLTYVVARRERTRTVRHLTQFYETERSRQEIRRLARGVFRHFGHSLAELLALRTPEKLFHRLSVSIEGLEYAEQAIEQGQGVLFVTGHFGNWELMAAYMAYQGYPIHIVAREIRQPILHSLIDRYRSGVGLRIHYTRGNGVIPMMRALRRGEILALLIDVRTEGDGRWVEFLGRPAYTLIGPAALAARTGAAVVFGYSVRIRPWEYRFVFHPAAEVNPPAARSGAEWEAFIMALLQSLNARLSTVVEQFPEQWMWMHRRHDPVRPNRRKR